MWSRRAPPRPARRPAAGRPAVRARRAPRRRRSRRRARGGPARAPRRSWRSGYDAVRAYPDGVSALRLPDDVAAWAELAAALVNTRPRPTEPPEKLVSVADPAGEAGVRRGPRAPPRRLPGAAAARNRRRPRAGTRRPRRAHGRLRRR